MTNIGPGIWGRCRSRRAKAGGAREAVPEGSPASAGRLQRHRCAHQVACGCNRRKTILRPM
ncbi:hypothetical protein [Azospirillum endophyticum]